jgi:predicted ABC-type ATPase
MPPHNQLFIIAGANGSGKTTLALEILSKDKNLVFINADEIAKKLNPQNIDLVKIQAGKTAINQIHKAIQTGQSLIWESTISGNFAKTIIKLAQENKYQISLLYVFVDNPQICIERIKVRSLKGGHTIPQADILRRYRRSKKNFFEIKETVDYWDLLYNGSSELFSVANNKQTNEIQKINFVQIFTQAVHDAIAENKSLGVPSVFCINGKTVYQLPNGEIVTKYDFKNHK